MRSQVASRTAVRSARHRAAHQVLETGSIYEDPFAAAVLGVTLAQVADEESAKEAYRSSRRFMRLFMASRARYSDDQLNSAVERGFRQVVVLGAGLDTIGIRKARQGLRIFELDHPATQEHKIAMLRRSGVMIPEELSFVPIDFESESLADVLTRSGVDLDVPTFINWMGVVQYLTPFAVKSTLESFGCFSGPLRVVFDFLLPESSLTSSQRAARTFQAEWVRSIDEPWLSEFSKIEVSRLLADSGFELKSLMVAEELLAMYPVPGLEVQDSGEAIACAVRVSSAAPGADV